MFWFPFALRESHLALLFYRLAGENVYYIEVLQKQKRGILDHVEVAVSFKRT